MGVDDWTEAQTVAAPLLARGVSRRKVADHVQVSERAISKWLANPLYQRHVSSLRDQALERTVAILTANSVAACKRLGELVNHPLPTIALAASRAVIELMLRVRELAEMDSRLAAIEAKLAESDSDEPAPRPYGNRWASPQ